MGREKQAQWKRNGCKKYWALFSTNANRNEKPCEKFKKLHFVK